MYGLAWIELQASFRFRRIELVSLYTMHSNDQLDLVQQDIVQAFAKQSVVDSMKTVADPVQAVMDRKQNRGLLWRFR